MATKPSPHDRIDLDFVMGLIANSLLSDDGIKQMQGLMGQAKDPTGVLAQIIYHAISHVHDVLQQKDMKVSNKIWIARGGVVDQSIAEVTKLISAMSNNPDLVNPQLLEEVRSQIVDLLKQQQDSGSDIQPEENQEEPDTVDPVNGGVMPPGEPGGSHGPDRMPAPQGLLAGG